jgi:hypothetical protein
MAIEEEFSIEIPDKDADAIHSGMCIPQRLNCRLSITGVLFLLRNAFSLLVRPASAHKLT